MISDPYKELGVSSTDSKEEITKAYRKLAKKYHPDLNQGGVDTTKKMSEINAAYEQIKSGKATQSSNGGYSDQRSEYSEFDQVNSYLSAGYYNEALNVLENITSKSALWYYYSAIANIGVGNKITSLNHAKIAVQMEPNNFEYQRILSQIQNGSRVYQMQSQNFGMPLISLNKLCLGFCFAKLFCGC